MTKIKFIPLICKIFTYYVGNGFSMGVLQICPEPKGFLVRAKTGSAPSYMGLWPELKQQIAQSGKTFHPGQNKKVLILIVLRTARTSVAFGDTLPNRLANLDESRPR